MRRPSHSLATVRLLLQDVADGIRVLRARDGLDISDDQILERARNIVTGLVGNYRITSRDPVAPRPPGPRAQLDLLAALDQTAAQIAKAHATDA